MTPPADTTEAPAVSTESPAAAQPDFSESNFQAYKEAENREALDRVAGKLPTREKPSSSKEAAAQPADLPPASSTGTTEIPAVDADLPPAKGTRAALPPAEPQKWASKEETRKEFEKLTASNRELKIKVDEYERRQAQPPTPPAAVANNDTAKSPALQPAAAKVTRPEPSKDDIDPATKQPKYSTFGELMAAQREWDREQVLAQIKEDQAKTQRETQQQEQSRIINEGWAKKVEAGAKKYSDYATVALNPDLPIKAGSVADVFVLDSEHGADVLYYLGQHPDKLDAINKLNPLRQARELFAIEQTFVKPAPSVRRTSAAPAPPHEVSGQGAVPPDEVEQALADDDFTSYKAAENRKALARAKGK